MTQGQPKSFLIIRMGAFGDIICALPALRALRSAFPEARIGWVVDEKFRAIIAADPDIDEIFTVPLARWERQAKSLIRLPGIIRELSALRRGLRCAKYDVCLDLQGLIKSGVVARMARCGRTLQMAGDRLSRLQWAFPAERVEPHGPHAVDRMIPLAAAVGANVTAPRFDLHIPQDAREGAQRLLDQHEFGVDGPLVVLQPGAGAVHRMWPQDSFVQAARELRRRDGARIVISGGPGEEELAGEIAARADVGALCVAGQTTPLELAALLELCDVAVVGDTGPMHVAAAVGTPTVALFGPANPERTGPHGDHHIVIQKPFPCQPCFAHPTCKDYACMAAIGVDEVVEAVVELAGR